MASIAAAGTLSWPNELSPKAATAKTVREALELIDFIKEAFGAEGKIYGIGSQGGFHSEFKIGDSTIMIGGGGAWKGTSKPTALHYYVDDVDAVYQRSLEAGECLDQAGDFENAIPSLAPGLDQYARFE